LTALPQGGKLKLYAPRFTGEASFDYLLYLLLPVPGMAFIHIMLEGLVHSPLGMHKTYMN